ncbi:MAG: hypothetical protein SFW67_17670 [Myxococcaceae bacterium]|nr:hypothetical protein [Myxococcaceae bacterium]
MTSLLVALIAAAECEGCHEPEVTAWAASRHAVSATNSVYLAAVEREPERRAWCQTCHAPTGNAELGVSCQSCHSTPGRPDVVRASREAPGSPHPIRVDPTLSTVDACASCHTFDFPGGGHRMQRTVDEHRSSGSVRSCQGCHLAPAVGHRMPGGHDVEFVRRALSVSATAQEAEVVVTLKAARVGHRVPTGDPFRRLRVSLCLDRSCSVSEASFELGRVIAPIGPTWRIASDTTLSSDETATFRLRAPRARFVRVTLHFGAVGTEARIPVEERALEVLTLPLSERAEEPSSRASSTMRSRAWRTFERHDDARDTQ